MLEVSTIRRMKAALSCIFTQALEDGHIGHNPALKLGKFLKRKDQSSDKEIKPLTAHELELYLNTSREFFPRYYPLFLTLGKTGMRIGEALGLQWGDIDFNGRFIEIKRAWVYERITTPKDGKTRRVRMTQQLT